MTLEEAIRKAETQIGGKVIGIGDYKDRWIFCFDWQTGTLSSVVWCCYKDTGDIGCFFPPDEPDVLKLSKEIPLPKKLELSE